MYSSTFHKTRSHEIRVKSHTAEWEVQEGASVEHPMIPPVMSQLAYLGLLKVVTAALVKVDGYYAQNTLHSKTFTLTVF